VHRYFLEDPVALRLVLEVLGVLQLQFLVNLVNLEDLEVLGRRLPHSRFRFLEVPEDPGFLSLLARLYLGCPEYLVAPASRAL